jgi:hypothetical protein
VPGGKGLTPNAGLLAGARSGCGVVPGGEGIITTLLWAFPSQGNAEADGELPFEPT